MGIDEFKARLERLLSDQRLGGSARAEAGALHEALVDLKVGLKELTEALSRTERDLGTEREQLAAAERRGQLAADIGDQETATIAREFAERHRQRVELLDRKLAVQKDELAIAQSEYDTLSERYRSARQGVPGAAPNAAPPPLADDETELLKGKLDRRAVESAVDAQLEMLKKKLGKN